MRADEVSLEAVADLGSVRAEWDELAAGSGNVFATWEWADAWRRHLARGAEPAVAMARRDDGTAVALLPLYLARRRPVRVVRFIGAEVSDELGPVCRPDDAGAAAVLLRDHARDALGEAGVFLAERLPGDSGVVGELGGAELRHAPSPVLPIDGQSFDDFLHSRSRNFRSQLARHERRIDRSHRLVYRLSQDPDRLAVDMQTLIRLHELRWPGGSSQAFAGERAAFHRDFAARALERGWLRLWTMELDGVPAAAWYGLRFQGVETYYQAGRDPSYDALKVGFVLLCHTIRSAFEDGQREYRFGLGGEDYKSRFSAQDSGLDTVAVPVGVRGRLAVEALKAALRLPEPVRERARRVRSG